MNIHIIFALITFLVLLILIVPIYLAKDIERNHKVLFSIIIAIFFFTAEFLLYKHFGTPEIIPLMAEREEQLIILKEKITTNSLAVKKNPKNIKAWVELADNFMESNQYSAAANSYKQAVLLSEGNPELILSYAYALIIDAGGKITEEAKKSLDIVLMLQPTNEKVRYFLAIYKMQFGNTKEAMEDIKKLYKSLPDDSQLKDAIDKQIGRK